MFLFICEVTVFWRQGKILPTKPSWWGLRVPWLHSSPQGDLLSTCYLTLSNHVSKACIKILRHGIILWILEIIFIKFPGQPTLHKNYHIIPTGLRDKYINKVHKNNNQTFSDQTLPPLLLRPHLLVSPFVHVIPCCTFNTLTYSWNQGLFTCFFLCQECSLFPYFLQAFAQISPSWWGLLCFIFLNTPINHLASHISQSHF